MKIFVRELNATESLVFEADENISLAELRSELGELGYTSFNLLVQQTVEHSKTEKQNKFKLLFCCEIEKQKCTRFPRSRVQRHRAQRRLCVCFANGSTSRTQQL